MGTLGKVFPFTPGCKLTFFGSGSHLICDWISHYIQWKNIKSIAKIQDREEIFLDVVTGTSCVDLKEQEFR